MTEKELSWSAGMRAGRLGESRAYEAFLTEFAAFLRQLVGWYLRRGGLSPAHVEDIVQEILIAVHSKRDYWDETRPLVPWLNAIARYKLIDATRKMRRDASRRSDLTDAQWSAIFAEGLLPGDRSTEDMERLISALPAGQRSVVRAIGIEGATPGETAARFSMSEGAVRVAFHRSLKKLKALAGGNVGQ